MKLKRIRVIAILAVATVAAVLPAARAGADPEVWGFTDVATQLPQGVPLALELVPQSGWDLNGAPFPAALQAQADECAASSHIDVLDPTGRVVGGGAPRATTVPPGTLGTAYVVRESCTVGTDLISACFTYHLSTRLSGTVSVPRGGHLIDRACVGSWQLLFADSASTLRALVESLVPRVFGINAVGPATTTTSAPRPSPSPGGGGNGGGGGNSGGGGPVTPPADTSPPVVTIAALGNACGDAPLVVHATITDNVGVTAARIFVPGVGFASMTGSGSAWVGQITIPSSLVGTTIQVQVSADDHVPNVGIATTSTGVTIC